MTCPSVSGTVSTSLEISALEISKDSPSFFLVAREGIFIYYIKQYLPARLR